jgi:hypothetical protein
MTAPERIWLSRAWASTFTDETVHQQVVIPYIAISALSSSPEVRELILAEVEAERERCAAMLNEAAATIEAFEAEALTWGGPDPRGFGARVLALHQASHLRHLAAAIRGTKP